MTPPGGVPDQLAANVDKTCSMLLEFLDINNISKSAGVSAMASLLVSILASQKDEVSFNGIIKMMQMAFKETRDMQ
jgi:hypothetical protein